MDGFSFCSSFSVVKLTRTLDKPIPRLSVEYVSVFAVSLIVLLFSIKKRVFGLIFLQYAKKNGKYLYHTLNRGGQYLCIFENGVVV